MTALSMCAFEDLFWPCGNGRTIAIVENTGGWWAVWENSPQGGITKLYRAKSLMKVLNYALQESVINAS